jgi:hypothetical protein
MTWSDLPRNPSAKVLRQFAAAWLVVFLAMGAHQAFGKGHQQLGAGIAIAAVVIGVLGLVRPLAVKWIFVGWMMLAFPIGWLVSQVVLLFLFYVMLTPVALFFRLTGRDSMCRKLDSSASTYWIAKEQPQDPARYLRQY